MGASGGDIHFVFKFVTAGEKNGRKKGREKMGKEIKKMCLKEKRQVL